MRIRNVIAPTHGLITLVLSFIFIIQPLVASANYITLKTPANGSVLSIAPSQVTITGSVPLVDLGNQLTVTDPQGVRVDDGSLTVSDKALTVGIKPLTVSGSYTVSYSLLGVNDVPLSGTYTFTFNAPAVIESPSALPTSDPDASSSAQPVSSRRGADVFVIGLLGIAFLVLIALFRMARNTLRK